MFERWFTACVRRLFRIILLTAVLLWVGNVDAGHQISPYWIYFPDKGNISRTQVASALTEYDAQLTVRSRARRLKLGRGYLVDEADLSIHRPYMDRIIRLVGRSPRHTSRWLNAVSFDLSADQIETIRNLPFVERVEPVRRYVHRPEPILFDDPPELDPPQRDYDNDYGGSLRQNEFLNVPELHDRGYFGRDVLIGVVDAGFNNLEHVCFEPIDIVAAWDFVNNDDDVDDGDDMGEGRHGTHTLSIIAAWDPGQMIGIAPQASFVLAKTENTEWERPIEEDHWVAAIEWMDSLGVEIVSSSLGYIDWYDYEELDGNTAVTTIAADRAVSVGMVIVNAMGNTGRNNYPLSKMNTPSDGDSVFSIGATNRDSSLAPFSSHGPTYDGRIKPDFVTYGSSVRLASHRNNDRYAGGAGTSFSTPAIAGLCALLIEADPFLTPIALRDLLREVSHNRDDPDTLMGWGIPDALAALEAMEQEEITLIIPLRRGWTTVSHNLSSDLFFDVEEIFAPIVERGNLLLFKDEFGNFYHPQGDFNRIPLWNPVEGYQARLLEADTLILEGQLSVYTDPIFLSEGWHIVSYRPNFTLPIRDAFRSLVDADALDLAKDHHGHFYWPEQDFCNMLDLRPGFGYHLKLNRNAELIYPRRRVAGIERNLSP
ncbi:MAG: S8 family serine peptidase, partial [Candidatus Electryoneaceae bacterium]|nr:S8 family serine peptidase [Candidatus Electryoneaceae bacterium]